MATRSKAKQAARMHTVPGIEQPEPFSLLERIWLYYSSEWVFAIMEPWEVIIVHIIIFALFGSLAYGLTFVPGHARFLAQRAHYYLYGTMTTASSSAFHDLVPKR